MPFGITVTGNVFQRQLDQCFGKIDQVIVIADDIMMVGKQHNHRDHDIALKICYRQQEDVTSGLTLVSCITRKLKLISLEKHTLQDSCKPAQSKVSAIVEMPPPTSKK